MYHAHIKSWLDVFMAVTLLIITLPISLVIALAIKLDSYGPIIFSHTRCGRNNQPFTLYKFRTVPDDAPNHTPTREVESRAHFTRVGRILRKLSLDEIPQLYNVIRGDMSIIGPRPVLYVEKNLLDLRIANGANKIRPGITGWAQIHGRDEIDNATKAQMDHYYACNLRFITDVKCVAKTFYVVLSLVGQTEGHEMSKNKILNGSVAPEQKPLRRVRLNTAFYARLPKHKSSAGSRVERKLSDEK